MKFIPAILVLAVAAVSPAQAQAPVVPVTVPADGSILVTLSATEQMNVKQDELQGSLRIEIDSKDSKEVQDKINKAMQEALALAKNYGDVKTSTGQYYVYSYDPNPQPQPQKSGAVKQQVWKGNQTIDIKSKNAVQLLELAGKIQELGFVMNGLNYMLSSEQEETYKDTLTAGALKKVQSRADVIAKALGKPNYQIVSLVIDAPNMVQPMPVMYKAARMEMASDANMAGPVAQAGEQQVSLTVNAQISLKP